MLVRIGTWKGLADGMCEDRWPWRSLKEDPLRIYALPLHSLYSWTRDEEGAEEEYMKICLELFTHTNNKSL